jgi:hypothetical protein
MSRQLDGWDLAKALCVIGTVAGILSWLSGEKKGGSLALVSMVSGGLSGLLEPRVCDTCDVRTIPEDAGFRCPSCLRLVPKLL